MPSNLPPGTTDRDIDRAMAADEEYCEHGQWGPDCTQCDEDALSEWADQRMAEMKENR